MLLVKSWFWYFGWLRYFLAMSKHWVAPNPLADHHFTYSIYCWWFTVHPLRYLHKMAGWWLDSQVVTAPIFAKSHPHPQECIPVRQVISSLYSHYISSQGDAPTYDNMDVLGSNINQQTINEGHLIHPLKMVGFVRLFPFHSHSCRISHKTPLGIRGLSPHQSSI